MQTSPRACLACLLMLVLACSTNASRQTLQPTLAIPTGPVLVQLHSAPQITWLDSVAYLKYELHVSNLIERDITLDTVSAFVDEQVVAARVYSGEEIGRNLMRIAAPSAAASPAQIGSGQHAILFVWLPYRGGNVPRVIRHRVALSIANSRSHPVLLTKRVEVEPRAPVTIGPPLRGGDWLLANGPDPDSLPHHSTLLVGVDGLVMFPQRFSGDWVRFGPEGRLWHDNIRSNGNWYGWGAELIAVADGMVVEAVDSMPDNVPPDYQPGPANRILLDIGGGRFAAYAHLQQGSSRVRAGSRVRRGDVLALLGNSGNSTGPHLHFHVTDAPSAIAAEGVSFVFDHFCSLGAAPQSLDAYDAGAEWIAAGSASAKRQQHPRGGDVIRFTNADGADCAEAIRAEGSRLR